MSEQTLLVHVSCPPAAAPGLAEMLVEQRLAACVNIIEQLRSVYRWQGSVENEPEALLLIKTTASEFPLLQAAILGAHPYELPEIIAVKISAGYPPYLDWIKDSTA